MSITTKFVSSNLVHAWQGVFDTTLCDKVCQWLVTGCWFFLGTPVPPTNKTGRLDITEILLKVALNTITLTLYRNTQMNSRQKYTCTSKWKSLNSNWTYNKSQDKQVLIRKCYYAWQKVSLEKFVNIHLVCQSTKLFEMVNSNCLHRTIWHGLSMRI